MWLPMAKQILLLTTKRSFLCIKVNMNLWHGREMLTNWLQRNFKKGSLRKVTSSSNFDNNKTVLSSFLILLNLSDMDSLVQDSTDSLQMLTKRKLLATWLPMTSLASRTLQ